MKKAKQFFAMMLAVLMMFSLLPMTAFAEAQAIPDFELTYEITGSGRNKTLTISGEGAMPDYSSASNRPWHKSAFDDTAIIINSGVTSIGQNAFLTNSNSLSSITIPSSVTVIDNGAFRDCTNLKSVIVKSTVPPACKNARSLPFDIYINREDLCSERFDRQIPNGKQLVDLCR